MCLFPPRIPRAGCATERKPSAIRVSAGSFKFSLLLDLKKAQVNHDGSHGFYLGFTTQDLILIQMIPCFVCGPCHAFRQTACCFLERDFVVSGGTARTFKQRGPNCRFNEFGGPAWCCGCSGLRQNRARARPADEMGSAGCVKAIVVFGAAFRQQGCALCSKTNCPSHAIAPVLCKRLIYKIFHEGSRYAARLLYQPWNSPVSGLQQLLVLQALSSLPLGGRSNSRRQQSRHSPLSGLSAPVGAYWLGVEHR